MLFGDSLSGLTESKWRFLRSKKKKRDRERNPKKENAYLKHTEAKPFDLKNTARLIGASFKFQQTGREGFEVQAE